MPSFIQILGVRPSQAELPRRVLDAVDDHEVNFPEVGDDEHTFSTLEETLERLGEHFPSLEVDVVYAGDSSCFDYGYLGLVRKRVSGVRIGLSLARDTYVDPEVPTDDTTVEVPLDRDADEFVDALEEVAHHEADASGRELTLPSVYDDKASAMEVLASIAAAVAGPPVRMLVCIEEQYYRLTLGPALGAILEPLFPWTYEPRLREWVRGIVAPLSAPVATATTAKAAAPARRAYSRSDPRRPLTTGSRQSRILALSEMRRPPVVRDLPGGGTVTHCSDLPVEGAVDQWRAAVAAPENQGEAFAKVRKELYGYLRECSPPAKAAELLEKALHTESEALRCVLYDELSRVDDPVAHRAMVFGFKHDSDDPQDVLRKVLWRSLPALEILVREELVPTWKAEGRSSKWCKRIVRLLKEEMLPVPRAWLADAPADLVAGLPKVVESL